MWLGCNMSKSISIRINYYVLRFQVGLMPFIRLLGCQLQVFSGVDSPGTWIQNLLPPLVLLIVAFGGETVAL